MILGLWLIFTYDLIEMSIGLRCPAEKQLEHMWSFFQRPGSKAFFLFTFFSLS